MRKVAKFLNKDLPNEVIENISENCSFDKLKAAKNPVENKTKGGENKPVKDEKNGKKPNLYRKGIWLITCDSA